MTERRDESAVPKAQAPRGSRFAFQIGSMFGIPIRIHVTFVLILIWFGLSAAATSRNVALEIAFILALFGCVVLHETGHALMARRFGVRTSEIILYPFGGVARLESIPGGWAELLIALAGPMVNVVLAAICAVALAATHIPVLDSARMVTFGQSGLVPRLLAINVMLVVFNMIPAFPMDGGRVLRAILSIGLGQATATRIAGLIGQLIAAGFVVGGLLRGNVFLAFIGVFVFLGAAQEMAFQTRRRAVVGHTAREAMLTKFEVLAPHDTLGRAAELLLSSRQHDFPVVDAWHRVAGVLPRATLMEALARSGRETPVLDVMLRDPVSIPPTAGLEEVLERLQADPARPLLVLEDGVLRGMITLDNLAEFIVLSRGRAAV
jgi:stage IV sporulation protein FB